MTTTSHTPGPWQTKPDGTNSYAIEDQDGLWIAATYGFGAPDRNGQEEANARLIAATPDLLKELKRLYEYVNEYSDEILDATDIHIDDHNAILDGAAAAIAKAEGKSAKEEWGDPTLTEDQAAEMLRKERS